MGENPSAPRVSRMLTFVVVFVIVLVALAIALRHFGFLDSGGGDDGRPPVIVNNGSLIFNGGDPGDSPQIKYHWRNWVKDSSGSQWKPDFPGGFSVDHYDVTVTTAGQACAAVSGDTVAVEFTRTDGGTPSPATFTLLIQANAGKQEPKVDPGAFPVTPAAVVTGTNGVNTVPAKLTFSASGYISKMTVSSAGTASPPCQFGNADNPVIKVQPQK